MRPKALCVLALAAPLLVSCRQASEQESPPVLGPSAGDDATATTSAGDCSWSFSGNVYRTSPAGLQGSATTQCSSYMSSIYVAANIQYAYSSSGPWYNWFGNSNWGYGTSVSVITAGPVQCGLYYRVAGTHYWPGGSLNTFGYPSYMYC